MKWKLGIVAAFILGIVVYNLPYFQELRAYNKVLDVNQLYQCESYLLEYPNGRHAEDVHYLKIELSGNEMSELVAYLKSFPEGKYSGRVNEICDSIWDEEIARYENKDKSNYSEEAVVFMREMLSYLKKNRINIVALKINSKLDLKDYEEFGETVRKLLEALEPGIKKKMVSLKGNFSQGDNQNLQEILAKGLSEGLDGIFSEGFIQVMEYNGTLSDFSSKVDMKTLPMFSFDYTIANQMSFSTSVPNVWTYSEAGVEKNLLLGIDITFDVKCTIPHSDVAYAFHDKGNPGSNIDGIDDIKDGYRRMTSICFAEFSNRMSTNLGIAEVYFQGEE